MQILDGGLSNVLESQGCDLNHKLWTANVIKENPEAIVKAHLDYINSGADIITTSSYQASIPGLAGRRGHQDGSPDGFSQSGRSAGRER